MEEKEKIRVKRREWLGTFGVNVTANFLSTSTALG
jgi:hypothetical protein